MADSSAIETIGAARKAHSCDWCAQRITIGSTYKRWRYYGGDSDGVNLVKVHPECHDALVDLQRIDRSFGEWTPGDFPRGCHCDHDPQCARCQSVTQSAIAKHRGDK